VEEDGANTVARMWTVIGVILCVAILVYLTYVARKAVDEELDDETGDEEERLAFLPSQRTVDGDSQANIGNSRRSMAELHFSAHIFPPRQALRLDSEVNLPLSHGREEGHITL
jgi:hypothetical protein